MKHTLAALLLLATSGGPALAQISTSAYREQVTLPFDAGQRFSNSTPHSAPQTHDFTTTQAGQRLATASVTFASDPAPYIDVAVGASQALGTVSRAAVQASLGYAFAVDGPANSFVPINFRGRFEVQNDSFLTYTNAQVYLTASTLAGTQAQGVGLWVQCDGSASAPRCFADNQVGGLSTLSSLQASLGAVAPTALGGGGVAGSFSGVLMAATDAAGHGQGQVELSAFASAAGFIGYLGTGMSSAFIDPELRIDPAYLASHPTAALRLTPGVGSDIAAVPEPAAVATMLTGLALLAGVWLRRRRG